MAASIGSTVSFFETSQGKIAYSDTNPESTLDNPAVVFIHGNSASKEAFRNQVSSPDLNKYRLICIDLPGHGESDPAKSPEEVYSFPGYADVVAEVVNGLGVNNFAIVGWSLGGHIALESIKRIPTDKLKGMLITGAPPIELSPEGIGRGFLPNPKIADLLGKEVLESREEALFFAEGAGFDGTPDTEFMVESAFRTDGLARKFMFQSIGSGVGDNEVEIVKSWKKPITVIAGEKDSGINTDYIRGLTFKNLWENTIHVVSDADHPVHWQKAREFNVIAARFFDSLFS